MKNKPLKQLYDQIEKIDTFSIWKNRGFHSVLFDDKADYTEVRFEREFLHYHFNKGQLIKNGLSTDSQGLPHKQSLDDTRIEYLKNRLKKCSNLYVRSRYAHLLWQNRKHNDFAKESLTIYFNLLKSSTLDFRDRKSVIKSIVYISASTKLFDRRREETVLNFMFSSANIASKYEIFSFAVSKKALSKDEMIRILNHIPSWIRASHNNYHGAKSILTFSASLSESLGVDGSELYSLLADVEQEIIDRHSNEPNFLLLQALSTQIFYRKKAGQFDEAIRLSVELNRRQQDVKLKKSSFKFDSDKDNLVSKIINFYQDRFRNESCENILAYFSFTEDIFPDPMDLRRMAEKNVRDSISQVMSIIDLDINNNVKLLSEEEKILKEVKTQSAFSIGIMGAIFNVIIYNAILLGNLSYELVYQYFKKHTWYPTETRRAMTDEYDGVNNLFSLIAPGLHNLFSQFEYSVANHESGINNFVLAIDSLTLKFESSLRWFVKLAGGTTTRVGDQGLKEQNLEQLLKNDLIKEYFSPKEIYFFKYVFTKEGKDIRNSVAHSYYLFSDYNIEKALLVFVCFLKLGKYEFKEKNPL